MGYSLDDLRAASRNADALTEESGIESYLQRLGIRPADFMHVAEQRAIRAVILASRGEAELKRIFNAPGPQRYGTPIDLSPTERSVLALAMMAFSDGLVAGLSVREGTGMIDEGVCERCRLTLDADKTTCPHCGFERPLKGEPFMCWTVTIGSDTSREEAHDLYAHNTHTARMFMERLCGISGFSAYGTAVTEIPTEPSRPDA